MKTHKFRKSHVFVTVCALQGLVSKYISETFGWQFPLSIASGCPCFLETGSPCIVLARPKLKVISCPCLPSSGIIMGLPSLASCCFLLKLICFKFWLIFSELILGNGAKVQGFEYFKVVLNCFFRKVLSADNSRV